MGDTRHYGIKSARRQAEDHLRDRPDSPHHRQQGIHQHRGFPVGHKQRIRKGIGSGEGVQHRLPLRCQRQPRGEDGSQDGACESARAHQHGCDGGRFDIPRKSIRAYNLDQEPILENGNGDTVCETTESARIRLYGRHA